MATIQDVARRAQVSPATVSRVLNSSSTVHPDLVRRVRAAVEALSYQPNGVARRLRRQESPLWAVIVPDVGNPFFTSMVRGVEDVAQGSGYSVVLCNTDENTGKEAGYIAAAAEERMAGVIIAPASTRDTDVTPLLDLRIPVVALDRRLRRVAADTVLVDNERAAEEATEHLLDMGYRRIACITGPGQAMTAGNGWPATGARCAAAATRRGRHSSGALISARAAASRRWLRCWPTPTWTRCSWRTT